jgi:hypothetical protein
MNSTLDKLDKLAEKQDKLSDKSNEKNSKWSPAVTLNTGLDGTDTTENSRTLEVPESESSVDAIWRDIWYVKPVGRLVNKYWLITALFTTVGSKTMVWNWAFASVVV